MSRKLDEKAMILSESGKPVTQNNRKKKRTGNSLIPWKRVLRRITAHPLILVGLLPLAALVFAFFIAPGLGAPAGIAVGSWEGVTQGLAQGAEDGEAAGLSAEDTVADVGTKLSQTGKLQVLLLDLKLSDLYTQGSGPQYAALLRMRGEGVFTVDLTQSYASEGPAPDSLIIEIPHPEFVPYLDNSAIETVAEYKAPLFDGSSANGYTGWLNTVNKLDERVRSELLAYGTLMEQAEASAIKQVELLAQSICGNACAVEVRFIEEAG